MNTNGVEVAVEESDSDNDSVNDDRKSNNSVPPRKKSYLNVFPKSCYENVQFKQSKGSPVKPPPDAPVSTGYNSVEVEVMNTLPSPAVNSPATTSPDLCPSTTPTITTTTIATTTTATTTTTDFPVLTTATTTSSDTPDVTGSLTSTAVTSTGSNTASATIFTATVSQPTTTHSNRESSATVASVSSENSDNPTVTSEVSTSTTQPAANSGEIARVVTKSSSIIEVGGINPVYQSWELKKKRSDSSAQVQTEKQETITTPNKDIPKYEGKSGAYDMMEPIQKPNTYSSSLFFSAPCSVVDTPPGSQISDRVQSIGPSSYYENVIPIGNGKFTVTPPDSVGSKDSDHFPLDSSPPSRETNLNRSNSTGSLLPHPTVQQYSTFYSPGSNRKDILHHSVSAGPAQMKTPSKSAIEQFKITIRGSTAISKGSVKKKINLFETNTLPAGKSLADMGIIEDDDDNNGFIV